jgi:hypothetical protein
MVLQDNPKTTQKVEFSKQQGKSCAHPAQRDLKQYLHTGRRPRTPPTQ